MWDIPCRLKTLLHSRQGYCELRSLIGGGRTLLFVDVDDEACNFSAFMSFGGEKRSGEHSLLNAERCHLPAIRFGCLNAPNLRQKFQHD